MSATVDGQQSDSKSDSTLNTLNDEIDEPSETTASAASKVVELKIDTFTTSLLQGVDALDQIKDQFPAAVASVRDWLAACAGVARADLAVSLAVIPRFLVAFALLFVAAFACIASALVLIVYCIKLVSGSWITALIAAILVSACGAVVGFCLLRVYSRRLGIDSTLGVLSRNKSAS